ncbi:MAG: hypothetical protein KBD85_04130 [Elusimicrobia bacterium]|nr:hypothetical protein [Elusimicrobiota bacterium]MBP9699188.1 hypothetical protein [Elusimicrobiota bacterium]
MNASPGQKSLRHMAWVALLGTLLSMLTGCVYLRLLEVKKQLQNFDEYFAISGRSELVIEFKKPVIRVKDTRFLIGAEPAHESREGEHRAHYAFILVRISTVSHPPPLARLTLDLAFDNGKLKKIIVPETFMMLFPRNVIVDTLKQAKDADVFELKKLARAQIHLEPEVEAELPSRTKTEMLLGVPLESRDEGDLQTLVYRYTITTARRPVPIEARLSFGSDDLLRKVFVQWDQSAIEAYFVRSQ